MQIKFFSLLFILLMFAANAAAQTADDALAKIGSQIITANDLNPNAQTAAANLPAQLAAARTAALNAEIAEQLFAAEAAARNITIEKLLETEVAGKVQNPSAAQIQTVYEANRAAFGEQTLAQTEPRIIKFLRREAENKATAEFADALKIKYKVAPGADINSPNLKPTDVLAQFGASKITFGAVSERLKPQEYALRDGVYQQLKPALNETIYNKLILQEAVRVNLPPEEFIKREVTDKTKEPTDADAQKFYNERKTQLNAEFAAVKTEILSYLSDQNRAAAQTVLRERLIKQNAVQILLKEPIAPVLKISTANAPSKGSPAAPVTVVMFSDFQCSHCAQTHPAVMQALKAYPGKARFVLRNFPLADIHENALRAAQAAAAARAQNKFFEYIELLYQNQNALDDAALKKYAAQIGLNSTQFDADLNSGKFDAAIRRDLKDGSLYGVRATPTIYVNGRIVNDLSVDGIKKAIAAAQK